MLMSCPYTGSRCTVLGGSVGLQRTGQGSWRHQVSGVSDLFRVMLTGPFQLIRQGDGGQGLVAGDNRGADLPRQLLGGDQVLHVRLRLYSTHMDVGQHPGCGQKTLVQCWISGCFSTRESLEFVLSKRVKSCVAVLCRCDLVLVFSAGVKSCVFTGVVFWFLQV